MKIVNKVFETTFTVFPQDTNYMFPMVFGGKVLSEMDIAAAMAVRRACNHSLTAKHAVTTVAGPVEFYIGAEVGDLILLRAEIVRLGNSTVYVDVVGERENKDGFRERICRGPFVFVTVEFLEHLVNGKKHKPVNHGLTMN